MILFDLMVLSLEWGNGMIIHSLLWIIPPFPTFSTSKGTSAGFVVFAGEKHGFLRMFMIVEQWQTIKVGGTPNRLISRLKH